MPKRAVLVSVVKDDGGLRLRLDDAVSESAAEEIWLQKEHFTNKLIAVDAFETMTFDEKELADFGYAILARLSAFIKRSES